MCVDIVFVLYYSGILLFTVMIFLLLIIVFLLWIILFLFYFLKELKFDKIYFTEIKLYNTKNEVMFKDILCKILFFRKLGLYPFI